MDQIRCIVASTENGERESVVFTDEFEQDAADWFPGNMTIDSDTMIDDVLPGGFPKNYVLDRSW